MKVQFTTRIEYDLVQKAKAVADRERRSLNNTYEWLIAKGLASYEAENGEITVSPEQE